MKTDNPVVIECRGRVQGVGFRPSVYRLAQEHKLDGWIQNDSDKVQIVARCADTDDFIQKLKQLKSPIFIESLRLRSWTGEIPKGFRILDGNKAKAPTCDLLPDAATCSDCLEELFDLTNPRYMFPFISCTHCGPRYSICRELPFERNNLTLDRFPMCEFCAQEYTTPGNRRFHAQTISCPNCGPRLRYYTRGIETNEYPLRKAADDIRQGLIVAVQQTSGFHLVGRADCSATVIRLRQIKNRYHKPFAILAPDMGWVRTHFVVNPNSEKLLFSPIGPIVLLQSRGKTTLVPEVNSNLKSVGVMLASNPIQHLLMKNLGIPLVFTSGNLGNEQILTESDRAIKTLKADSFLIHNLKIENGLDDSVFHSIKQRSIPLRRSKGIVPSSIDLKSQVPRIAVGGHLKNTIGLVDYDKAYLSPPIGDLESSSNWQAFNQSLADWPSFKSIQASEVVCDMHPDYYSTQCANDLDLPFQEVQHHAAHAFSLLAEQQEQKPNLIFVWDGGGYGADGKIWGSECFAIKNQKIKSLHRLKPMPLLGGTKAYKDTRLMALGILFQLFGENTLQHPWATKNFTASQLAHWQIAYQANRIETQAMGRLFDAIAALLDTCHYNDFEGQAAMSIEDLCLENENSSYEISNSLMLWDWQPILRRLLNDLCNNHCKSLIATRFHNTLANLVSHTFAMSDLPQLGLTGGVFQNKYLTKKCIELVGDNRVLTHRLVPANDSGLSLGQLFAAEKRYILCV